MLVFHACQNCVHARMYTIHVYYSSAYECTQLTLHMQHISFGLYLFLQNAR